LRRRVSKQLCSIGVASRLDDFIEDISVLIDRPPQPMLFAADGDDDLVEVPDIAAARALALEAAGRHRQVNELGVNKPRRPGRLRERRSVAPGQLKCC
jgi:hypothetical protein